MWCAAKPCCHSCESTCNAERQLQQTCGNSAANVKAKGCFHQKDQMYSHACCSCTQLSDRCCLVVGSNKAATCQKPQQDSMLAYFYCCTYWHVRSSCNGICSACRSTTMAYTVLAEALQGHTQCLQKHHSGIHSACSSTTMAYTVHAQDPTWPHLMLDCTATRTRCLLRQLPHACWS